MKKNAIDRAIEDLQRRKTEYAEAIDRAIGVLQTQKRAEPKKERKAKTPKPAPEI